ncbi:hypothetical protein [Corynebacterium belfantii]|uniref:NrtR DNA-binding winged helix domain-containing protein n=1 Tax=Corynebacterium belfantii TaxID=2014537 RepID=A0ABS0LC72_9CORY|nr:hypothetical protein [Corynebacterium belfantii]OLN15953.1 hypothetical protein BUE64_04990 [Corynebacterium diphtheriae subsp. lausannense]QVI99509.1 hypothetical protein KFR76_05450 [Corynebacterium diphtheriae]MBG9286997.1 hypothetical protein [Corynebacterium belfantii]MBG9310440.1 hypothetical protein [Corynebacterium belfantii]MBG9325462.1 hypothetical protein [Corynebacterium belfantii]
MGSTKSRPLRDANGTPKFRHESIACVFRVHPQQGVDVLTVIRSRPPYAHMSALPSGALETNEMLKDACLRHLYLSGVHPSMVSHIEQLDTRSAIDRDPYDRTIATAHLCLIPWDIDPSVTNGSFTPLVDLDELAFDHKNIIEQGLYRLRAKLSYSNIGFALAPRLFTISDLAKTYSHVLNYNVSPTNLQRILTRRNQLQPTTARAIGSGRPARLFTFTTDRLEITDPFATLKPTESRKCKS